MPVVRLGKVAPKVWDNLQSQGVTEEALDDAAAEAAEAAELMKLKAAELAREAMNKVSKRWILMIMWGIYELNILYIFT